MNRSAFKRFVPHRIRPAARRAYYLPGDTLDRLLGRRSALTPPKGMIFIGTGDFEAIGRRDFGLLRELGNLEPTERVLDVGCGIGRTAIPLTGYLDEGEYEGIDIVAQGIEWCQANITPKYPNFRFRLADIYNEEYNPGGNQSASDYRFPYEDGYFDFVLLISVFTHMLPNDVSNYLAEIHRVLRPRGRVLATFFLVNQSSLEAIGGGPSKKCFDHDCGVYRTEDRDTPEAAVAFTEAFARGLYQSSGLGIVEPIRYGWWSGRTAAPAFQDVVLARKESPLTMRGGGRR